jgi:hypothetical protein
VAWDAHNVDPSTTGEILIGSRDGRIFETVVEAKDKLFVEGKEKYFKPIYALGEDQVPRHTRTCAHAWLGVRVRVCVLFVYLFILFLFLLSTGHAPQMAFLAWALLPVMRPFH